MTSKEPLKADLQCSKCIWLLHHARHAHPHHMVFMRWHIGASFYLSFVTLTNQHAWFVLAIDSARLLMKGFFGRFSPPSASRLAIECFARRRTYWCFCWERASLSMQPSESVAQSSLCSCSHSVTTDRVLFSLDHNQRGIECFVQIVPVALFVQLSCLCGQNCIFFLISTRTRKSS